MKILATQSGHIVRFAGAELRNNRDAALVHDYILPNDLRGILVNLPAAPYRAPIMDLIYRYPHDGIHCVPADGIIRAAKHLASERDTAADDSTELTIAKMLIQSGAENKALGVPGVARLASTLGELVDSASDEWKIIADDVAFIVANAFNEYSQGIIPATDIAKNIAREMLDLGGSTGSDTVNMLDRGYTKYISEVGA